MTTLKFPVVLWVGVACLVGWAWPAVGQGAGEVPAGPIAKIVLAGPEVEADAERDAMNRLLEAESWPVRGFAMLRLQRFKGPAVAAYVERGLNDEVWQVRCFAVRAADEADIGLPEGWVAKQEKPEVLRAALRYGKADGLDHGLVRKWLDGRNADLAVLAIEMAVRSGDEKLIKDAEKKVGKWVKQMIQKNDGSLAAYLTPRIGPMLGYHGSATPQGWEQWVGTLQGKASLQIPPAPLVNKVASPTAALPPDQVHVLTDYLSVLADQQIDMVFAIDATGSMTSVIHAAREAVDDLLLLLNDLSKSTRLGVVAFQDATDRLDLQVHEMTTHVDSLRDFLYRVETGGGRGYGPVLHGLKAAAKQGWRRSAQKQILLIGDADPPDNHSEDLRELLTKAKYAGVRVDTVTTVGTKPLPGFEAIAKHGGGSAVNLDQSTDIARVTLRSTLDKEMWPYFEEFFDVYRDECLP